MCERERVKFTTTWASINVNSYNYLKKREQCFSVCFAFVSFALFFINHFACLSFVFGSLTHATLLLLVTRGVFLLLTY